jgi:hypothetical protein
MDLPDGGKQENRMRLGQSIDIWLGAMPKPRLDSLPIPDSVNQQM